MLISKTTDQENDWSAKLSLCTSSAVLGPTSRPKSQPVNQSTKKSTSQPKVNQSTKSQPVNQKWSLCTSVAFLGSPSPFIANLFSSKSQSGNQKSIRQPARTGGGVLAAESRIDLPRSVAN